MGDFPDRDAHGEATGETLYMVRETKSSIDADDLRRDEERKIEYGKRHFKGRWEWISKL